MTFRQWRDANWQVIVSIIFIMKYSSNPKMWVDREVKVPGITNPEYVVNVSNMLLRAKGYVDYIPALVQFIFNGQLFYVCNEAFLLMPVEMQTVIMEHEVGHFELGHHQKQGKWLSAWRMLTRHKIVPNIEYEADDYAIKSVGEARFMDTLTYMIYVSESQGVKATEWRKRRARIMVDKMLEPPKRRGKVTFVSKDGKRW